MGKFHFLSVLHTHLSIQAFFRDREGSRRRRFHWPARFETKLQRDSVTSGGIVKAFKDDINAVCWAVVIDALVVIRAPTRVWRNLPEGMREQIFEVFVNKSVILLKDCGNLGVGFEIPLLDPLKPQASF